MAREWVGRGRRGLRWPKEGAQVSQHRLRRHHELPRRLIRLIKGRLLRREGRRARIVSFPSWLPSPVRRRRAVAVISEAVRAIVEDVARPCSVKGRRGGEHP